MGLLSSLLLLRIALRATYWLSTSSKLMEKQILGDIFKVDCEVPDRSLFREMESCFPVVTSVVRASVSFYYRVWLFGRSKPRSSLRSDIGKLWRNSILPCSYIIPRDIFWSNLTNDDTSCQRSISTLVCHLYCSCPACFCKLHSCLHLSTKAAVT